MVIAPTKTRFDSKALDYLLTAWGHGLRNGWEPRIAYPPNLLSRYHPRSGWVPPTVTDDELQRVNEAWHKCYEAHRGCGIAIWFRYVDKAALTVKLARLKSAGYDWSERKYRRNLHTGKLRMSGSLLI